jgi:hypothetical protein
MAGVEEKEERIEWRREWRRWQWGRWWPATFQISMEGSLAVAHQGMGAPLLLLVLFFEISARNLNPEKSPISFLIFGNLKIV